MGNSVPRVGIAPMSLLFRDSVLTIIPHKLPEVNILPMPTGLFGSLLERGEQTNTLIPLNFKPFNAYKYIHTGHNHTYKYTW